MIVIREKGFENAKPSALEEKGRLDRYSFARKGRYTDLYVDEIHSGVTACKVWRLINRWHTHREIQPDTGNTDFGYPASFSSFCHSISWAGLKHGTT